MSVELIWLIPALPLAAFVLNGLFGRFLKESGGWLAFLAMAGAAAMSIALLAGEIAHADPHHAEGHAEAAAASQVLWEWMAVGDFTVQIAAKFDPLTAIMLFVVTFVGSLVFLYSIGYMHGDEGFNRFFAYLSLFAFSMLVLVLADNFLLLFVGWEGVGLCSYLLIGYYMSMEGAPDAGKKAFIVNRVGDFGFLLAMFLIWKACGTLNISEVVRHATELGTFAYAGTTVTAITLLLFLGCTGKSAQIPLFVWLPDAMAGPTPVSALIHAATMVTAGVYLVVRTSALFALSPFTMSVMAVIGALTAFVAGTIALTQRDIKKVLAYSTVSQLGYMFLACGVGAFAAGIFHVMTHAFFKGCLFLGAGAVIHSIHGIQDLNDMGGLKKKLPLVSITFLISCFAIAGFPLTSGFFSKDEILFMTFRDSGDALRILGIPALYWLGIVTALMTAIYSFRAYFLAFDGESRVPKEAAHHFHGPGWTMKLPLVILAAGALVAGFLNVPHTFAAVFGAEGANFHHFLMPVVGAAEHILEEHPAYAGGEGRRGHGSRAGDLLRVPGDRGHRHRAAVRADALARGAREPRKALSPALRHQREPVVLG
jgi:NADH-quinone oxidoreductase subunit L